MVVICNQNHSAKLYLLIIVVVAVVVAVVVEVLWSSESLIAVEVEVEELNESGGWWSEW